MDDDDAAVSATEATSASTMSLDYAWWDNSSSWWDDDGSGSGNWSGNFSGNFSSNFSKVCRNEYCVSDEDYLLMIEDYIFPSPNEWVLTALHFMVFVIGLVGNFLVCLAVYRNQTMRTVTNYFIVNLAIADFLVVFICLPPTVLWDVTETWFLGAASCKVVIYFQTVSVSVSVLTLTFISTDRWYAICFPLKFKSTTGRAKVAIFFIWFVSLSVGLPELIVYDTRRRPRIPIHMPHLTDCFPTWSEESQKTYQIILMVMLYVSPFVLMSVAYNQIVRVLWRNDIPGSSESTVVRSTSMSCRNGVMARANSSSAGQIRSRRKAAKMLMAVVVMFGICNFPVHLLNVLRYSIELEQNDFTTTVSLLSHWMFYANSAMNPLIYNFMSGKFRKEFRKGLSCCCCFWDRLRHGPGSMSSRSRTNTYQCKYISTSTRVDTIHLNSTAA